MKYIKNPVIKSITALLKQGKQIIDKMVATPAYFATAAPLLATAQTAIDLLRDSAATAEGGSKADTQAMYLLETDFRVKLMILVLFVDVLVISNPIEAADIIASAGLFEKRQGAINVPPIAVKLSAVSGTVVLKAKAEKRRTYLFQMKKDSAAAWDLVTISTTSKIAVAELSPLTVYWFRVALIKGTVQGDFVDPVSITVV